MWSPKPKPEFTMALDKESPAKRIEVLLENPLKSKNEGNPPRPGCHAPSLQGKNDKTQKV